MQEEKLQNGQFSTSLLENLVVFRREFQDSIDFVQREFRIGETAAAILSIEGLIDKRLIAQGILKPILDAPILQLDGDSKLRYIRDHALATSDQIQVGSFEEALDKLMSGFAVLAVDGCNFMIAFGVQGFSFRSIQEPSNEKAQRGSREGFVEPLQINISMIRRRMKTPQLMFERLILGSDSHTAVALCYLRGTVSPEIVQRVRRALRSAQLESVMAAGYLSPFLEQGGIFSSVGLSERPDTVCGKIAEGRVAILVDGTPNVLLVPYLFTENFQSFDDYANRPFYAAFIRWLKYLAFTIAVFLPGFFVAIGTFHPELLPETLLIKISQAEASTPFPLMAEAIILHFMYEIMREAGLRVPETLTHAVSIVGALVIGETAVNAGLIGGPTLLVIAMTAIAGYVVPKLYEPIAILRLLLIIVGGILGIWGILLCTGAVLLNICSESAYRVPFTAPLSPFQLRDMRDVLIRASWKVLGKDRELIQNMPGSGVRRGKKH